MSLQRSRPSILPRLTFPAHQPDRAPPAATGHAQRFPSAFKGISPHFLPRRHLLSAADYRQVMADRFAVWNEITGTTTTTAA